jgi:hypothetical protein
MTPGQDFVKIIFDLTVEIAVYCCTAKTKIVFKFCIAGFINE